MQHKAETATAYLNELADDWRRETVLELRKLILATSTDITEHMDYNMLAYGDGKSEPVFHLNAQKHHVGLYVGDIAKVDPDNTLLNGIDTGKGCIRFKKSNHPNAHGVAQFIKLAIQRWQAGDDIAC